VKEKTESEGEEGGEEGRRRRRRGEEGEEEEFIPFHSSSSSEEEEWVCSVCGRTDVTYWERCRKQQCHNCYRR
jgi:hypothetical protein